MRMIETGNLVMSIVEREPSGFRITVKQPITTALIHAVTTKENRVAAHGVRP